MERKKPDERELAARDPRYRKPPYEDLSSLVAGRMQAGPQSTPPRAGFELDDWQDPELFQPPEICRRAPAGAGARFYLFPEEVGRRRHKKD